MLPQLGPRGRLELQLLLRRRRSALPNASLLLDHVLWAHMLEESTVADLLLLEDPLLVFLEGLPGNGPLPSQRGGRRCFCKLLDRLLRQLREVAQGEAPPALILSRTLQVLGHGKRRRVQAALLGNASSSARPHGRPRYFPKPAGGAIPPSHAGV